MLGMECLVDYASAQSTVVSTCWSLSSSGVWIDDDDEEKDAGERNMGYGLGVRLMRAGLTSNNVDDDGVHSSRMRSTRRLVDGLTIL